MRPTRREGPPGPVSIRWAAALPVAVVVLLLLPSASAVAPVPGAAQSSGASRSGAASIAPVQVRSFDRPTIPSLQPIGAGPPAPKTVTFGFSGYVPLPSLTAMPAGAYQSLVYDPTLGAFISFGGETNLTSTAPTFSNSVWTYVAGGWRPLCGGLPNQSECGSSPPARAGGTLLWDAADSVELLVGGWGPNSTGPSGGARGGFNDLWSFSDNRWTNLSTGIPSGLWDGAITYDSEDGYVVAVSDMGGTFTYSHGQWMRIDFAKQSPPARSDAAIFDDPALKGVVLYGGIGSKNQTLNDTWLYAAGAWKHLNEAGPANVGGAPASSNRAGPLAATYDPHLSAGILYDPSGTGTNQTWELTNGTWSDRTSLLPGTTGGVEGVSLAWDGSDGYGVLYVSANASTNAAAWTLSDPLSVDLGEYRAVIDAGQSWMFSPNLTFGLPGYRTDLLGTPSGCTLSRNTTSTPTLACSESSPAVLNLSLRFSDLAGRTGISTYRLTVHADPQIAIGRIVPNPTSVGVAVHLAAATSLGTPPYSALAWSTDGTPLVSNSTPSVTFSSTGNHSVDVRVVDATGFSVSSHGSVWVNADPRAVLATNRTATPKGVTDAGLPLAYTAGLSGGTGVVSCAWNFGDHVTAAGCNTLHAFRVPGVHSVRFWANDSVGAVSAQNYSVVIAPTVEAVLAEQSVGALTGSYVSFSVSGLYGIGPYAVQWDFGDGGSAGNANASHAFGIPGTYTVTATLTDAVGGRTTATELVTISPSISPGPGGSGSTLPGGSSGSIVVPGGARPAPPASTMPGGFLEAALAISLAGVWMALERRRRAVGGPALGWVSRLGRALAGVARLRRIPRP